MPLHRKGFTLIELLVVVVIVGILAAVAIPKFQSTKGKANFAAMKSDLHNLMTAEEGHFFEHHAYTTFIDSLSFSKTRGMEITINEATSTGWSATATHPLSYPHRCAMYFGNAAAVAPATAPGVVTCD